MRLFVLVCVLLGGMGQGVVAPRMPELLSGSSRLVFDSGVSAALMYLGIFVASFGYGRLADRGRVHWLLSPGLAAYAAILVLLGFAASTSALFALRFLEGLALSAIFVSADFALGRLSPPDRRAKWLSLYGVALSIGLILGPLASLAAPRIALAIGAAPAAADAPLLPLSAVAVIALGLAAFAWRMRVPAAVPATEADQCGGAARFATQPLIGGVVYGFMEASLVAVFPALAVTELHLTPESCLLVAILSAALFSVAWGAAADRFGSRRITLGLIAALAIAPAALAVAPVTAALGYASCVLFGLIAGGLYPVGFAWLLEGIPEARYGHASGAFARAYGVGSLIGPLAAGASADRGGFPGLLFALSAAGLLALAAIFVSARRGRRG